MSIKLSEQYQDDVFKGYKKFIGGRLFTLGKDEALAQRTAQALVLAWATIEARGGNWTDEEIAKAKAFATGTDIAAEKSEASKPTAKPKALQKQSMSRLDAFNQYKASLRQLVQNKEIGTATYQGLCDRLDASMLAFAGQHFSTYLDGRKRQKLLDDAVALDAEANVALQKKNVELYGEKRDAAAKLRYEATAMVKKAFTDASKKAHEILGAQTWDSLSYDDLILFKAYWTRRPLSMKLEPVSVQTVVNNIHAIARMLRDVRKPPFRWSVPEFWDDALRFRRNTKSNMQTVAERSDEADDRDHMTGDDLARYFKIATGPKYKAWVGLAFWCAWTQKEIATLRKVEVYKEKGETYIDKRRSKTGEWGKWWIPKPVADLLWATMAKTPDDPAKNPMGLAYLTENNLPLVHQGSSDDPDGRKTDVIGNRMWPTVMRMSEENAGRSHSFKWFRKSAGQMIKNLTKNGWIAKAFMAQDIPDVADEHYLNRMIDESIDAAKKLWPDLEDAFTREHEKESKAA